MFQYMYEISGSMMRESCTPLRASSGLSLPPSSTFGASGPSMFMMSSSPFWNASSRDWSSSMIEISTRPTCGIFLPFICATSLRVGVVGRREVPGEAAVVRVRRRARSCCCAPTARAGTGRCRPDWRIARPSALGVLLDHLARDARTSARARARTAGCSRWPSGGSASCSGRRASSPAIFGRSRTCRSSSPSSASSSSPTNLPSTRNAHGERIFGSTRRLSE